MNKNNELHIDMMRAQIDDCRARIHQVLIVETATQLVVRLNHALLALDDAAAELECIKVDLEQNVCSKKVDL